ncbi:MAG: hypothetical protein HY867_20760 [Chloroflexi bacterium]|nr:hypothetical protein [Chloroflexota bacterium]
MKKIWMILAAGLLMLAACAPTPPATTDGPSVDDIVAATMQALTAAAPPPTSTQPADGMAISFQHVRFVIPDGLATNALAGTVPAVNETEGPMMANAPEHVKFEFDNYALSNIFHDAQILIFPMQEYAAMNEGAAGDIAKLQAIINGTAAADADNLPHISIFNAAQVFAAQIQTVKFANGSGVRYITEYAQYVATVNNADMFYCFQGLTNDGKYYILAILPISHPLLAYDANPETVIPEGGIPFPGYDNTDASAFDAYYDSVIALLNQQAANSFMPTLVSLDKLIESITIAP